MVIFQGPCWPPGPLSLCSHLLHISKAGPSQPRLPAFQAPIWSLHNGTDPPASDRPLVLSCFWPCTVCLLSVCSGYPPTHNKSLPLTMERSSGQSLHCTPTYIFFYYYYYLDSAYARGGRHLFESCKFLLT